MEGKTPGSVAGCAVAGIDRPATFDTGRKLVRVNGERHGMVDFDFAVGDLALSVEMMLPAKDFQRFCEEQGAILVINGKPALTGVSAEDDAATAMSWMPSDVQNLINRSVGSD